MNPGSNPGGPIHYPVNLLNILAVKYFKSAKTNPLIYRSDVQSSQHDKIVILVKKFNAISSLLISVENLA